MKKIMLASLIGSALATTLPSTVHAAGFGGVYSNITGVQLWLANMNVMTYEAPGSFTDLRFDGWAADNDEDGYVDSANLQFTGLINFTINALNVRLDFDLSNGGYVQGSGITFTGGDIQVDIQTTSGWFPYATIDASTTNMGFLANQPGHWSYEYPTQTTAGIIRDLLPGLWDGVPGSANFNRGVGSFTLLGQNIGFYMAGDLAVHNLEAQNVMRFGPPEVPVPAAAWLFGSGLAGLAGARRLRRRPA